MTMYPKKVTVRVKGTLLKVVIKLLSFQDLNNLLKMSYVLLLGLVVDQDIIKVYNY